MTNKYNPPIFVISLKHSEDRRAYITKELARFGLEFEFFDAVDGASLDSDTIKKVCSYDITKWRRPLSNGEIGCALSHISVWQKMLDEGIDEAIIFEDDVVILDNFIEVMQNIKNANPKKWHLILFGYIGGCCINTTSHNKSLNFILKKPTTIATRTHAYLLNKSGAARLIQQTSSLDRQIDGYTGNHKIVDVYCVHPLCVAFNEDFVSVIEDEREDIIKKHVLANPKPQKAQSDSYIRLKTLRKYRFIAKIIDIKNVIYSNFIRHKNNIILVLDLKFRYLFKK